MKKLYLLTGMPGSFRAHTVAFMRNPSIVLSFMNAKLTRFLNCYKDLSFHLASNKITNLAGKKHDVSILKIKVVLLILAYS